jgi:hypothetical protein
MLADKWLHLKNIIIPDRTLFCIILFRKYLVDIRSEAWLNLFWESINGNCFAADRKPPTIFYKLCGWVQITFGEWYFNIRKCKNQCILKVVGNENQGGSGRCQMLGF